MMVDAIKKEIEKALEPYRRRGDSIQAVSLHRTGDGCRGCGTCLEADGPYRICVIVASDEPTARTLFTVASLCDGCSGKESVRQTIAERMVIAADRLN